MCGITGSLNLNGNSVSSNILRRMSNALIHRGPNGAGVVSR